MHRDLGPHPAVRAVVGLALGVALGVVVALLLPREPRIRAAGAVPDPSAER